MNKKGFTLIELLAVIVVLAVIALIATPMVLNTIEDARKGAAVSSAYAYISAVETKIASEMIKNPVGYTVPSTITETFSVDLKGEKPTSVSLTVSNAVVTGGTMQVGAYTVTYANNTATVTG